MKFRSGSGNRADSKKELLGNTSSNNLSSANMQKSRHFEDAAIWEEENLPRIVKSDGTVVAAKKQPAAYTLPNNVANEYSARGTYPRSKKTEDYKVSYYAVDRNHPGQRKRKRKRRLITASVVLLSMVGLYCLCVFSNIPFIAKWRTIYIETALMTMSHQWLATSFIPKSVVDEVRAAIASTDENQEGMESDWGDSQLPATRIPGIGKTTTDTDPDAGDEEVVSNFWDDPEHEFYRIYHEIDRESFIAYANEHQDTMFNEDGFLFIDEADLGGDGTSIKTIYGDQVLALDTVNGIILARLAGGSGLEQYLGVIAIVKDPSKVGVAVASRLGIVGEHVAKMAEKNNAILAINASGFEDVGGVGNGGVVDGLLVSEGVKYGSTAGSNYKVVYLDYEHRLHVGAWKSSMEIRNGVEFKPILVLNGEQAIKGSAGWGTQPRTAIGQTEDGSIIMIVIDGRQPGYSVGTTVGELAEIFLEYGAVQALNLDGGSSSIMYYNGRKITSPSGGDKVNGRYLPDAFVVYANSETAEDPEA